MKRRWRSFLTQAGITLSAILFLLFPAGATSASGPDHILKGWEHDPTLEKKWQESVPRVPGPPPATQRLLPVPLGPADTLKLYIDPDSVTRLDDGVARMTLVLEARGGVRNVFFDGIRCETKEYKTYAVGRPDGSWLPIRKPRWQKIPYYPANAYRHQLMKQYVCSEAGNARKPHEIIQDIRFPPTPID